VCTGSGRTTSARPRPSANDLGTGSALGARVARYEQLREITGDGVRDGGERVVVALRVIVRLARRPGRATAV